MKASRTSCSLSMLIAVLLLTGVSNDAIAQTKLKPQADGYIYLAGGKMNDSLRHWRHAGHPVHKKTGDDCAKLYPL
jgi:hypothetical protein